MIVGAYPIQKGLHTPGVCEEETNLLTQACQLYSYVQFIRLYYNTLFAESVWDLFSFVSLCLSSGLIHARFCTSYCGLALACSYAVSAVFVPCSIIAMQKRKNMQWYSCTCIIIVIMPFQFSMQAMHYIHKS